MEELEYAKCIISDEGMDVDIVNQYCVRAKTKSEKYVFDILASHNKKSGNFIGYTILRWSNKRYYKKIFDLEDFIRLHK